MPRSPIPRPFRGVSAPPLAPPGRQPLDEGPGDRRGDAHEAADGQGDEDRPSKHLFHHRFKGKVMEIDPFLPCEIDAEWLLGPLRSSRKRVCPSYIHIYHIFIQYIYILLPHRSLWRVFIARRTAVCCSWSSKSSRKGSSRQSSSVETCVPMSRIVTKTLRQGRKT